MRGRTQFWLGSVSLAVVIGLLGAGLIAPRPAVGQEPLVGAEGRGNSYALVTGIEGTVDRSQTLYLVDDLNDIFYILEYSSRSRDIDPRKILDLRRFGLEVLKKRAQRERERRP